MEPEQIKWNRNSCRFPSEAQSALKPGPTVVRTRKPKFLNRDGYEKPKWVREMGVLSALATVRGRIICITIGTFLLVSYPDPNVRKHYRLQYNTAYIGDVIL